MGDTQTSPVDKLPEELIVAIISQCKAMVKFQEVTHMRWVYPTQVCQRWRAAGLNDPSFWSSISNEFPSRWIPIVLQRSKAAPISLWLTAALSDDPHMSRWLNLLAQPHRLSRLYIRNIRPYLDACTTTLISASAPNLTELNLHNIERWPAINLPLQLLGGGAPKLQSLKLSNCSIPWSSPILKGNHTIFHYRNAVSAPPLAEVLAALDCMPNLIDLRLATNLSNLQEVQPSRDPVKLPQLQSLGLEGTVEGFCGLLPHLSVPPSAEIFMGASNRGTAPLQSFREALSIYYSHPSASSSQKISSPCPQSLRLVITPTTTSCWFGEGHDIDRSICTLHLPLARPGEHAQPGQALMLDATTPIFTIFPFSFSNIRYLEITGRHGYLAEVLGMMRSLVHVHLSGSLYQLGAAAPAFVECLYEEASEAWGFDSSLIGEEPHDGVSSLTLWIPCLESIAFTRAEFYHKEQAPSPSADKVDFNVLVQVLRFRASLGIPIRALHFHACSGLLPSEIATLSDLVEKVTTGQ